MSETIHCQAAHQTMWDSFAEFDSRHGFLRGHIADFIASQIHFLRTSRAWSQKELASRADVSQPQISTWERGCDNIRLDSLLRLAEAFDVGLTVRFAPFSEVARDSTSLTGDRLIPSFDGDSAEAISITTRNNTKNGEYPRRHIGIRVSGRSDYIKQFGELASSQASAG